MSRPRGTSTLDTNELPDGKFVFGIEPRMGNWRTGMN